jgi:hypothetical protein
MAFRVDSLYQWCSNACSVVTAKIDDILAVDIEPPTTSSAEDLNTTNPDNGDLNNHVADSEHEDLNRGVASDHEDLDDSTVVSDHSSMTSSDIAVTESDGGVPVNRSGEILTMTDIMVVDEAPSTPASSSTTTVQGIPEREPLVTNDGGSVALEGDSGIADDSADQSASEDDTDESWISVPYVLDQHA